jgi:hypothetical protein
VGTAIVTNGALSSDSERCNARGLYPPGLSANGYCVFAAEALRMPPMFGRLVTKKVVTRTRSFVLVRLGLACSLGLAPLTQSTHALADAADPALGEWSVAEGYSLGVVARGLELPTAVVPVPQPGTGPKSPKFLIAQLRGRIRVLASDGSLSDFASVPTFKPHLEWPDYAGEAGLGGLCLDPEHGYVFATYAYRDATGVLRNGISRFSAQPQTFEGAPSATENYSELLVRAPSAFSHQIGSCVVSGGALHVAVGDGGNPAGARDPQTPVGKILRLTLDGKPFPENALAASGGSAALLYAWGLRNPFGLAMVGGKLYSAENGVELDRLLLIQPGRDHGWDGTDASIAMNALAVFRPTIGPAHLAYAPPSSKALPASQLDRFVIAASNCQQGPGLLLAELDPSLGVLTGAPRYIVHYDGSVTGQAVTGVAVTAEGIYFTAILPVGASAALLRASYDSAHAHQVVIGKKAGDPMVARGCLGCHSRDGLGGRVGPPLDANSIITRTETKVLDPAYVGWVEKLDQMGDASIVAGRAARREVLEAGRDQKVRTWVVNRIMNPRFDMPEASMPQLNIGREEAERIAEQLLGSPQQSKFREAITSKRFMGGIALGMVVSLLGYGAARGVLALIRRTARAKTSGAAGSAAQ